MNAVIDADSFKNITEYIEFARNDPNMDILCGGTYDDLLSPLIDKGKLKVKLPSPQKIRDAVIETVAHVAL